MSNHSEYHYSSAHDTHDASYLVEPVLELLGHSSSSTDKLFELGCGNGSITNRIAMLGYDVTAVDTSKSGIAIAKKAYAKINFQVGSAYDDLASIYGTFDRVVSLEVIEHVFSPKTYAKTLYDLVNTGGTAIISTPYHGYLKNIAVALSGKFDAHVDPLWEGGHIKFWSKNTLTRLLSDAGFNEIEYKLVGRIPALAKSMIAIAKK